MGKLLLRQWKKQHPCSCKFAALFAFRCWKELLLPLQQTVVDEASFPELPAETNMLPR